MHTVWGNSPFCITADAAWLALSVIAGEIAHFEFQPETCSPGNHPFRLLTTFAATFPKGTASVVAAKFPAVLKGVPLGELALRSKD